VRLLRAVDAVRFARLRRCADGLADERLRQATGAFPAARRQ
jgi:hypothetical protein